MKRTAVAIVATALGALCFLAARDASAQSSGGSGGPLGEQSDFPCPGCVFGTPNGYDPTAPTPLLITFHGDEGAPTYIHRAYYGTDRQSGPAYDKGFLVLSLQCPRELGCADADPDGVPSWWRWLSSTFYDPAWVGQQVDKVEAAYDVSLRQIYLASFSGGSSFLRRYAFQNADRFAGAIIGGGGGQPANACLTTCKIPIFISIGTADFLYDNAQATRAYCEQCGHELYYSEHPGIDHTIINEDLPIALDWLLERPHPCIAPDPGTGGTGTGGSGTGGSGTGGSGVGGNAGTGGSAGTTGGQTGVGGTAGTSTGSGGSLPGTGGSAAAGQSPIEVTGDAADDGGCACRAAGKHSGASASAFALLALCLLGRRRRSS